VKKNQENLVVPFSNDKTVLLTFFDKQLPAENGHAYV